MWLQSLVLCYRILNKVLMHTSSLIYYRGTNDFGNVQAHPDLMRLEHLISIPDKHLFIQSWVYIQQILVISLVHKQAKSKDVDWSQKLQCTEWYWNSSSSSLSIIQLKYSLLSWKQNTWLYEGFRPKGVKLKYCVSCWTF